MKIRTGFVSNSSSSSFVIHTKYLSPIQIDKVKDHINEAEKIAVEEGLYGINENNWWSIHIEDEIMECYTHMDNFDLLRFMEVIGIPIDKIRYTYEGTMKIRNGFVSNSSSSSFCVWGTSIDPDDVKAPEEEKEDFIDFMWSKNLECESDEGTGGYMAGLSPNSMGADQTLNEFKLEICEKFKELGIDISIDKIKFINEISYG